MEKSIFLVDDLVVFFQNLHFLLDDALDVVLTGLLDVVDGLGEGGLGAEEVDGLGRRLVQTGDLTRALDRLGQFLRVHDRGVHSSRFLRLFSSLELARDLPLPGRFLRRVVGPVVRSFEIRFPGKRLEVLRAIYPSTPVLGFRFLFENLSGLVTSF